MLLSNDYVEVILDRDTTCCADSSLPCKGNVAIQKPDLPVAGIEPTPCNIVTQQTPDYTTATLVHSI